MPYNLGREEHRCLCQCPQCGDSGAQAAAVGAVSVLGDICWHVFVSQALLRFSGEPQGTRECWAVEGGIRPKVKVSVK